MRHCDSPDQPGLCRTNIRSRMRIGADTPSRGERRDDDDPRSSSGRSRDDDLDWLATRQMLPGKPTPLVDYTESDIRWLACSGRNPQSRQVPHPGGTREEPAGGEGQEPTPTRPREIAEPIPPSGGAKWSSPHPRQFPPMRKARRSPPLRPATKNSRPRINARRRSPQFHRSWPASRRPVGGICSHRLPPWPDVLGMLLTGPGCHPCGQPR